MSSGLYFGVLVLLIVAGGYLSLRAISWPIGGSIVLGDDNDSQAKKQRNEVAVGQYRLSFTLVMVAGVIALALWTLGVLSILIGWNVSGAAIAVSLAGAAGSSVLFGYFIRVWRECRVNADFDS